MPTIDRADRSERRKADSIELHSWSPGGQCPPYKAAQRIRTPDASRGRSASRLSTPSWLLRRPRPTAKKLNLAEFGRTRPRSGSAPGVHFLRRARQPETRCGWYAGQRTTRGGANLFAVDGPSLSHASSAPAGAASRPGDLFHGLRSARLRPSLAAPVATIRRPSGTRAGRACLRDAEGESMPSVDHPSPTGRRGRFSDGAAAETDGQSETAWYKVRQNGLGESP